MDRITAATAGHPDPGLVDVAPSGGDAHDHDGGLALDLPRVVGRRRALAVLGLGGLGALAACSSGGDASTSATGSGGATSTTAGASTTSGSGSAPGSSAGAVGEIPEETAGPFPGDGSNGPNVLSDAGVVRRDITASFGGGSAVAQGVATTVRLTLVDVSEGAAPIAGAAVYAWHCDAEGRYSIYDAALADEDYLRGVQESAADGTVTFTTIFPGCYAGRWPHIHFEVYESLDAAASGGPKLKTSQLAAPADTCTAAYRADGYDASARNFSGMSIDQDMVFSDGYSSQMATATGSVEEGFTLSLAVGL
jgi:protocatechuate 3,4-dioxygenase beta subunit